MTSVLRRYAQIEPRIQYFQPLTADTIPGWTFLGTGLPSSVMTVSAFEATFEPVASLFVGNYLLKDLGRQITVYNSNVTGSPHVAVFRQVMQVNGPNREGISSNIGFICTWDDGSGYPFIAAPVARSG